MFDTAKEAAIAYDRSASILWGRSSSKLNYPIKQQAIFFVETASTDSASNFWGNVVG